jgi:predicted site-specific integrase-resolvase
MNLAAWAERNGVARVTGYRWFHWGRVPVRAQRVGRLILVNDAAAQTAQRRRTAVSAPVWSQGRERVVLDSAGVDDDLVCDMTEILTSMCARLCGKRAAAHRAKRASTAAADDVEAA